MELVRPEPRHLPAYVAALERGWSPDNLRPAVAQEQLQRIDADAAAFLALMDDPLGAGPPVTLPDGSCKPRIPGLVRWMWDEAGDAPFCGSIGLRWLPGDAPLPPHVLGHIGYTVVPWQRRRGHATRALARVLPLALAQGLSRVELTTDPDNLASQRVILANGGVLVEHFDKGPAYDHAPGLRYCIALA